MFYMTYMYMYMYILVTDCSRVIMQVAKYSYSNVAMTIGKSVCNAANVNGNSIIFALLLLIVFSIDLQFSQICLQTIIANTAV